MAKRQTGKTAATELEAAVLGVVWRDGSCTPYTIRQHFLSSPSPRWSGSAGAIYPLVRRLESRGWLRSASGRRGHRAQRNYRITANGTAALRRWLRTPFDRGDATLIHDPLRTRMLFLRALPREQASRFLSVALETLRETLGRCQADCRSIAEADDPFEYATARNAMLITRARVKWLIETKARLDASG